MTGCDRKRIRELLEELHRGRSQAKDELSPILEALLEERHGAPLRPVRMDARCRPMTLLEEVWEDLAAGEREWEPLRLSFLGAASTANRRLLVRQAQQQVEASRSAAAAGQGGGQQPTVSRDRALYLLALDAQLRRLAESDPFKATVMELRFFGGLTAEDTGELLGLPPAAAEKEWQAARLWVHQQMLQERDR